MSGDITEPRSVTTDDRLMTAREAVDERVQALPEGSPTRSLGFGLVAGGLACVLFPRLLSRLVSGSLASLVDVPSSTAELILPAVSS
ncbi:MAG: hypothetical protein V5A55_10160 [Halovenus sp.]